MAIQLVFASVLAVAAAVTGDDPRTQAPGNYVVSSGDSCTLVMRASDTEVKSFSGTKCEFDAGGGVSTVTPHCGKIEFIHDQGDPLHGTNWLICPACIKNAGDFATCELRSPYETLKWQLIK